MTLMSSYINYDFPKLVRDSGFAFGECKSEKYSINWNDIRVIDINKLIQNRDFSTVDRHIQEVLDCHLDSEFNVNILDSGFVKLFRLAQLSVEYLLECRRHLDLIAMALKSDNSELNKEMANLKTRMISKEEEIRKLQCRLRKRQKIGQDDRYLGISNILKSLMVNNENLTGEQNATGFNKCLYCDKVFINQSYLQSHISRRHSNNLVNDNVVNIRNSTNTSVTDKLHLEIKQLKEKLNAAEKENESMDDSKMMEPGEKSSIQEANNDDSKQIIQQLIQKNEVTIEMFEDWKQKGVHFENELKTIKSEMLENFKILKNRNEAQKSVIPNEYIEKMSTMSSTISKQEDQLGFLKDNMDERVSEYFRELSIKMNDQEKNIEKKIMSLEMKNTQLVEGVKERIVNQLNEFQTIHKVYQNRIEQLENGIRGQQEAMEEHNRRIIEMTEETNKIMLQVSMQTKANFKNNLMENQPRLHDEKPKIQKPQTPYMCREISIKNNETDKSSSISEDDIPDSIIKKPEISIPVIKLNRPTKSKTIKKPSDKRKLNVTKKKLKEELINTSIESTSESEHKPLRNTKNISTPKFTKSMKKALIIKPNIEEAVKKDLNIMFKKRLENLGVNSNAKTLSTENFKQHLEVLAEKQNLMRKQYKGYNRVRNNLLGAVNKEASPKNTKYSDSSNQSSEKPKPLGIMESILNKMKNKTMSITRSRENLRSIVEEKINFNIRKGRNNTDNVSTQDLSQSSSGIRKLSAKSILAMIDSEKFQGKKSKQVVIEELETDTSDEEIESLELKNGEKIVTTAISHTPKNQIDELLLSPIRKPKSSPIAVKQGIQTSSPIQSDDCLLTTGESTNNTRILERKAFSADNIHKRNANNSSPKSVLKTVSSINSLAKKKVNFDLDANEMKSLSSDDSSLTMNKSTVWDSSNSAINLKVNDNIETKRIQDERKFLNDEAQQVQVSTKQSPKIAEIASAIEAKLSTRLNIIPPAGSIETMFQAKTLQNQKIPSLEDTNAGSSAVNINMDSEVELSDWSIDELLK